MSSSSANYYGRGDGPVPTALLTPIKIDYVFDNTQYIYYIECRKLVVDYEEFAGVKTYIKTKKSAWVDFGSLYTTVEDFELIAAMHQYDSKVYTQKIFDLLENRFTLSSYVKSSKEDFKTIPKKNRQPTPYKFDGETLKKLWSY